jgi:hypothetical protein
MKFDQMLSTAVLDKPTLYRFKNNTVLATIDLKLMREGGRTTPIT